MTQIDQTPTDLQLRSAAAKTFMKVVVENLGERGVQKVLSGMSEAMEQAQQAYAARHNPQAAGRVGSNFLKFMKTFAEEAARQDVHVDKVPESDPARDELPPSPIDVFLDPMEALLRSEINGRAPAPQPTGSVELDQRELDEIELQLASEAQAKKSKLEFADRAEVVARRLLDELCAITKPGDFFRQKPFVWKMPEPPGCASACFPDNALVFLPSMTFQYNGMTITRNCAVNNKTVKVGHPLAYRTPDGAHMIRSSKPRPGEDERWVKAIRYTSGALIRYFTHIGNEDSPNMTWYGVVRGDQVMEISEGEYRVLEAQLARNS